MNGNYLLDVIRTEFEQRFCTDKIVSLAYILHCGCKYCVNLQIHLALEYVPFFSVSHFCNYHLFYIS